MYVCVFAYVYIFYVQVQKNNFQYFVSLIFFFYCLTSTKHIVVTNQNFLIVFLIV